MNLDYDCVRDVLIEIEKKPFNTTLSFKSLCDAIPHFTPDEIHYCCLKLDEAGFIDLTPVKMAQQTVLGIKSINDLTFDGHEFLSDIKNDSTWNKTKETAKKIGSFSLHAIADIASTIVTDLITKQF